jgi:hypothetical protein
MQARTKPGCCLVHSCGIKTARPGPATLSASSRQDGDIAVQLSPCLTDGTRERRCPFCSHSSYLPVEEENQIASECLIPQGAGSKLNSVPQIHIHPEPQSVTLFENKIFAGAIS